MRGKLNIGTSGWHYDDWRGEAYPKEAGKTEWLALYARTFPAVEVNRSFYRALKPETIDRWRADVPRDFTFTMKASQFLTHRRKLKNPEEPLGRVLDQARAFADQLGCILFQLPPRWRRNPDRLAALLELMPADIRAAFEFRDPDWHHEDIYEILRAHNAALVFADFKGTESPRTRTADFVYARLHGPGEQAYTGSYSATQLGRWARRIGAWCADGSDVLVFFDNDQKAFAFSNARRLKAMCGV